MKRKLPLLLLFTALPLYAAEFSAHVPEGWKIVKSVKGDLNGDGKADAVLLLQKQDKANIVQNEGLGSSELDTNPRVLKILLKEASGYKTAVENDTLIPPQNDAESPCLEDPFSDMAVDKKGRLKIELNYWLSCGSWWTGSSEYIFRYEKGRFRLIGYENNAYNRASGETNVDSDNYLTGKRKIVKGGNMFEPSENRPKTKWETIKENPYYLDEPRDMDHWFF